MSEVFFREAGAGPGVVCIHSNGSTSGQWRALAELLAPRFRVLMPDSYGSGKSPEWPSDREITLHDEAALLEPVFRKAGSPMVLVGHSYGGAVALRAAIENPARIKALVLYEPTLFALIEAEGPSPNDADGIRDTVARAVARLLVPALPKVEKVEFPGVGHMGPITHPELVNAKIAEFLSRL